MAQLSDSIERFIRDLMADGNMIELQRNELAQHFGCAPSQINYVLATRFSLARGYIIDSRRGGGGFIRIVQMREVEENVLSMLLDRVGTSIARDEAVSVIKYMLDMGIVTDCEAQIMCAAVDTKALSLPVSAKDVLRASVLRSMIITAIRNHEGRREP